MLEGIVFWSICNGKALAAAVGARQAMWGMARAGS